MRLFKICVLKITNAYLTQIAYFKRIGKRKVKALIGQYLEKSGLNSKIFSDNPEYNYLNFDLFY